MAMVSAEGPNQVEALTMGAKPLYRAEVFVEPGELSDFAQCVEYVELPINKLTRQLFMPGASNRLGYDRVAFVSGRRRVEFEFEGADVHDDKIVVRIGDKTRRL